MFPGGRWGGINRKCRKHDWDKAGLAEYGQTSTAVYYIFLHFFSTKRESTEHNLKVHSRKHQIFACLSNQGCGAGTQISGSGSTILKFLAPLSIIQNFMGSGPTTLLITMLTSTHGLQQTVSLDICFIKR